MWDIKDIKRKRKEILEKIEKCDDFEERKHLIFTLMSYLSMLNDHYSIFNSKVYDFINDITKSNNFISKIKEKRYMLEVVELVKEQNFIDKDYFDLLFALALNVSSSLKSYLKCKDTNLNKLNLSEKELIDICKNFYLWLGDEEISRSAIKILNNDKALEFCSSLRGRHRNCAGLNYSDYIYNDTYCIVVKENNINDILCLVHEVMHGVDFFMRQRLQSEPYFGFIEVPPIVMEYLLFDYLEEVGFDKNDIENLKNIKKIALVYKALNTYLDVYLKKALIDVNLKDNLSEDEQKRLVEVEAEVIAYGLYLQIRKDKEKGLANFKKYIKTPIPKNQKPDFTSIGLNDLVLLGLSQSIGVDYIEDEREYVKKKVKRN